MSNTQSYGQHNGHKDWLAIRSGLTLNGKVLIKSSTRYIKDISDDEAILNCRNVIVELKEEHHETIVTTD